MTATDNSKNINAPMGQVLEALNKADEAAALERVASLRELYPQATPDALVGMLIKQKCLQTGAIGQVTSSASIIPGVGVFVSLIFGGAADVGLTARMQAELVLEIATAYEQKLDQEEKQNALIMVAGMSESANQLLEATGQTIATEANQQLAQNHKQKPTLRVADAAGKNILTTYVVGQRANTYFKLGPEADDALKKPIRAVTSDDQQLLTTWLMETTQYSWQLINSTARSAANIVIIAGKSLGQIVIIDQAAKGVTSLTERAGTLSLDVGLVKGVEIATGIISETSKTLTQELLTGSDKIVEAAGGTIVDVRKKADTITADPTESLTKGAELAVGVLGQVGKSAGEGLVAGAGKLGSIVGGLFKSGKRALPTKKRKES